MAQTSSRQRGKSTANHRFSARSADAATTVKRPSGTRISTLFRCDRDHAPWPSASVEWSEVSAPGRDRERSRVEGWHLRAPLPASLSMTPPPGAAARPISSDGLRPESCPRRGSPTARGTVRFRASRFRASGVSRGCKPSSVRRALRARRQPAPSCAQLKRCISTPISCRLTIERQISSPTFCRTQTTLAPPRLFRDALVLGSAIAPRESADARSSVTARGSAHPRRAPLVVRVTGARLHASQSGSRYARSLAAALAAGLDSPVLLTAAASCFCAREPSWDELWTEKPQWDSAVPRKRALLPLFPVRSAAASQFTRARASCVSPRLRRGSTIPSRCSPCSVRAWAVAPWTITPSQSALRCRFAPRLED